MKKKKGFTLVELLAVIVILAVILIIAVPRITGVIKNAKNSSMEDASKLIATQAEKQWLINQTLSTDDPAYVDLSANDACSKVSKYNSSDYQNCNLTVNDNGQITSFSMTGKGKFAGLKCTGTSSSNITCTESGGNSSSDTPGVYACGSITQPSEGVTDYERLNKNVFIKYPETGPYTNSTVKSVCTLYKESLNCFEATSSAYSSNSSALQTLFGSEKCETGPDEAIDYTYCSDGGWDCVASADSYVECRDSDGVYCEVSADGSVYCYDSDK